VQEDSERQALVVQWAKEDGEEPVEPPTETVETTEAPVLTAVERAKVANAVIIRAEDVRVRKAVKLAKDLG
jgi:hypothetical protein